jgi:hypothetical protein
VTLRPAEDILNTIRKRGYRRTPRTGTADTKVALEFNYLQLKDGIVYALNQCPSAVSPLFDIVRYAEPVRAYQNLQEGRMDARVSLLPRVIGDDRSRV